MKNPAPTVIFVCGILALSVVNSAAKAEVPEPFQGFDDSSIYSINYDDLTNLLETSVVDKGRSKRQVVKPAPSITGTRMKPKIKKTANEGNRFHYEGFNGNEDALDYLLGLRTSISSIPDEMPLERFSRDEQLAYWLNLYNVTVLSEIAAVYPRRSLKKYHHGKRSIFSEKILTVSGVDLSLDDIQFTILRQNYGSNPLVLYGLYQGIVGGPNIRTSAYTGSTVYVALEDNAYEFINSNRGTYGHDDKTVRVSSFYDRSSQYFPKFKSDLSQHLLGYLRGELRNRLATAINVQPNINDWTVTDLGATRQNNIGGSLANNQAAMLDSFKGRRKANGGITFAGVIVKRPRDEAKDDDDVTIDDLGRVPGEKQGASVEEIAIEDAETGN
ncbi:MAG: DUF547 domain-containing protein [Gammaproteobacteria bacterium]|nr:DUF547 domain-containing protein [Gammaproteobacteria bacterium]